MTQELCHCGRELHYTDHDLKLRIDEYIRDFGEYVPVTVGKRTWNVQRHYIALHGIKGKDLATLGFEEITNE